jgi:hypothetical protein
MKAKWGHCRWEGLPYAYLLQVFLLLSSQTNTSFHTLGAHARPRFKSLRNVINTNQNEKQYPATWCPNKSSSGKHKLKNPMLTKRSLIMTQHKTKYHFWWFKKMYSLAMHRDPSPNAMFIAILTCINTQQL